MFLIIGLGNPGEKYEMTRHNVGFLALDMITRDVHAEKFSKKTNFHAQVAKGILDQKNILLVKPTTYMNQSGSSIGAMLDYYKLEPKDIILIHDDKDFDLGEIRIATESASAGHNGVRDIFDTLGTKQITRVRIGIGPKPEDIPTDAFVLSRFSPIELEKLKGMEEEIIKTVRTLA